MAKCTLKRALIGGRVFTEDDVEDEAILPEDTLASDEEIAEAIAQARANRDLQVRLMSAARFFLSKTKVLKRACEPEDLLQEAILSVMIGKRKWRTNRVDFKGLLVGVMRSMASNGDKALTNSKALKLTFENEFVLVSKEKLMQKLEETADAHESTEDKVINAEQETLETSHMTALLAKYEPDSVYRRILDKVREGFLSHQEIRETLGIEEAIYRNAWKVLMRAAESLNTCMEDS